MKISKWNTWVSSLLVLLLWLRIGQLLAASALSLDGVWWVGLWGFHWRRQTGRRLNLLSLVLLLPGLWGNWDLWFALSAGVLGVLSLRALHDEIGLAHHGWERYWP